MRIAKVFISGQHKDARFMEVVKVGDVQFDPRPGWVLVRDIHVQHAFQDVQWVHPADVHFEWVREFSK